MTGIPDMLIMELPGLTEDGSRILANHAVYVARHLGPKCSGWATSRLQPVVGEGYFGVHWLDEYLYFQETGTRAFTMYSLAGKTIPMWIDDPTGTERRKYPQAKTRRTASGKTQVLIFRRAARRGARKMVRRKVGGVFRDVSVPRSYPGAPGRIASREAPRPYTTTGKVAGRIAAGNIGVRWRNPGLAPRGFVHEALRRACVANGVIPHPPIATRAA